MACPGVGWWGASNHLLGVGGGQGPRAGWEPTRFVPPVFWPLGADKPGVLQWLPPFWHLHSPLVMHPPNHPPKRACAYTPSETVRCERRQDQPAVQKRLRAHVPSGKGCVALGNVRAYTLSHPLRSRKEGRSRKPSIITQHFLAEDIEHNIAGLPSSSYTPGTVRIHPPPPPPPEISQRACT